MEIKDELLKLAEISARQAVETVFAIIEKIVKDSENKIDDSILPFIPMIKKAVLEYIDKISDEV